MSGVGIESNMAGPKDSGWGEFVGGLVSGLTNFGVGRAIDSKLGRESNILCDLRRGFAGFDFGTDLVRAYGGDRTAIRSLPQRTTRVVETLVQEGRSGGRWHAQGIRYYVTLAPTELKSRSPPRAYGLIAPGLTKRGSHR
jgi:hypothetical protein